MRVSNTFYSGMYRMDRSAISGFILTEDREEKYVKDVEINRDWEVFTVNNKDAGYIRLCGIATSDKDEIVINIYRNGKWLVVDD